MNKVLLTLALVASTVAAVSVSTSLTPASPAAAAWSRDPTPYDTKPESGSIKVWTDPETGCQYLYTRPGGYGAVTLVPRTGRGGVAQVCGVETGR